jgi:palmitoyltransferase
MDWFLWPADCRFIYDDFLTAVSFVSACYAYLGVAITSLVIIQQLVLISQNLTLVELHHASARGWVHRWCPFLVVRLHNANNRGFCRNWHDFLGGSRRQRYHIAMAPV